MPSRRPNQVRVVEPENDRRLEVVSQALSNAGYDPILAPVLAEGFIARLRRRVYAALDDVVGTGDDLEVLAGWQAAPMSLASALLKAKYVREYDGVLCMVDAVNEAPEYIKKRWQRQNRKGYDAAVRRCGEPNVAHQRTGVPGDDDDYDYVGELRREQEIWDMPEQSSLFGAEPAEAGEKYATKSEHQAVVHYWTERYPRFHAGVKYPWRPRDFRHVAGFIDAVPDAKRREWVIDAYLACPKPYFRGHEWRKLIDNLAEFASLAGKPAVGATGPTGTGSQARTDAVVIRL
jgi:hypothetical protein